MKLPVDPRLGDIETDASSTRRRSLLAIAGSLLAEISLPKLAAAWLALIGVPALLLGLVPIVVTAWLGAIRYKLAAYLGLSSVLALVATAAVLWFGWRPLVRLIDRNFWSLNALAVQPVYAFSREAIRQLAETRMPSRAFGDRHATLRATTAAASGVVLCATATGISVLVWPFTSWIGVPLDLAAPHRLILPALANSVVLANGYLAVAALIWGIADATMPQPRDLDGFDAPPDGGRVWRIAHLSDVHVVGERYGWRIESGRSGPRGNERLTQALALLEACHARAPLDLVVISGDMTDAGTSAEWAEFLDAMACHPALAALTLLVPGNHDVNIVDRANPARLDLPTSPVKRLRQTRALSTIAHLQGERVRVIDHEAGQLGLTLSAALHPHLDAIARFADTGRRRRDDGLAGIWENIFPMVVPPDGPHGLGVLLLDSNASTHFSFTNALGMIPASQARGIETACRVYPGAHWLIVLHHHVVEYPKREAAFSERVGTALINASWFVRQLQRLSGRAIVLHGHRHVDWIGCCGGIVIVSAPSPVMAATDDSVTTCFYVQRIATGPEGIRLLAPDRINVPGPSPTADRQTCASTDAARTA